MNGQCAAADTLAISPSSSTSGALVEVVVANQRAEGFAAELAVLFLVDLLEQRALVPGDALVALEGLAEFQLGYVHETDLQHLVNFGVADEVVQAAPCAFELLEILVVHDQVDLLGQLAVEFGDDCLDRPDHVRPDYLGIDQRLLGERLHRLLDGALGFLGLGLELLLQQRAKLVALEGDALQLRTLLCFSHCLLLE